MHCRVIEINEASFLDASRGSTMGQMQPQQIPLSQPQSHYHQPHIQQQPPPAAPTSQHIAHQNGPTDNIPADIEQQR